MCSISSMYLCNRSSVVEISERRIHTGRWSETRTVSYCSDGRTINISSRGAGAEKARRHLYLCHHSNRRSPLGGKHRRVICHSRSSFGSGVDCSGSHSGGEGAGPIMTLRKRPRDPAQLAKLMIDIASGEVEDRPPTAKQVRAHKAGSQTRETTHAAA